MSTATIIGLVFLCVLAIMIVLIVIPKVVFYMIKRPLESRIAACYGQDEILNQDLRANSFGLESAGVWQVRGNGALVLTAQHLHFFMFIPKSDICIPLGAITELTITKSHLGKATLYDLLKVRFSAENKMDSIAWYLTDPRAWKKQIEERLHHAKASSTIY